MLTQDQSAACPPEPVERARGRECLPKQEVVPEQAGRQARVEKRTSKPLLQALLRALTAWPV
jgi:hypothetical protein